MITNYLQILEESLQKKCHILEQINELNEKQMKLFGSDADPQSAYSKGTVILETYDGYVDEKDKLIQELTSLDDGFESLYEKIKEELINNKAVYREQISKLQSLIAEVTDRSVSVQAQEARNKQLVEKYFSKTKREMTANRKASKAVYDYYKRNTSGGVAPMFMDKKQ